MDLVGPTGPLSGKPEPDHERHEPDEAFAMALRLICAREAEIEAFAPRAYWSVEVEAETGAGAALAARPLRLDGEALDRFALATRAQADAAVRRIREARFTVASVERRTVRRQPTPPFTTATLQQEASRRLGFGIKRTMELAQALYEGIDLGTETAGLVTYMRTDSTVLSKTALGEARRAVRRAFGADYLSAKPRMFRSPARSVREAHEAIRPTDFGYTPERLGERLGEDAARLYALVWNRTLASQMAPARFDRVEVELATAAGDIALAASGSATAFDGFLRLYRESGDDSGAVDDDRDRALPALREGESVRIREVRAARRETAPPPRYSEAGLVRRLEELGIGRPSTYAAIVGVLQDRHYVALTGRRFVPLERGRVATAFVEAFFGRWVEYGFTAGLEADLDRVAGGGLAWQGMLHRFWDGFGAALEAAGGLERAHVIAAIEEALGDFIYGPGGSAKPRRCPDCREGELGVRASRHGLFVGCGRWPECGYRRPLAAGKDDAVDHVGPKALGSDPRTGDAVSLRRGPYGPYVQKGESGGGSKPRRMSVPGRIGPEEVTLDVALALLALPREVGVHPESGEAVLAGIGRYGPWLRPAGR